MMTIIKSKNIARSQISYSVSTTLFVSASHFVAGNVIRYVAISIASISSMRLRKTTMNAKCVQKRLLSKRDINKNDPFLVVQRSVLFAIFEE